MCKFGKACTDSFSLKILSQLCNIHMQAILRVLHRCSVLSCLRFSWIETLMDCSGSWRVEDESHKTCRFIKKVPKPRPVILFIKRHSYRRGKRICFTYARNQIGNTIHHSVRLNPNMRSILIRGTDRITRRFFYVHL